MVQDKSSIKKERRQLKQKHQVNETNQSGPKQEKSMGIIFNRLSPTPEPAQTGRVTRPPFYYQIDFMCPYIAPHKHTLCSDSRRAKENQDE